MSTTASSTLLLPFQPSSMTSAQLAAVSYLARYSGSTHTLYAARLRRWFGWCKTNGLDPLVGIQRAHVELYLRQLGDARSRTVGSILLGMRTSSLRIE
jgi:integrase/recombinase XerD